MDTKAAKLHFDNVSVSVIRGNLRISDLFMSNNCVYTVVFVFLNLTLNYFTISFTFFSVDMSDFNTFFSFQRHMALYSRCTLDPLKWSSWLDMRR